MKINSQHIDDILSENIESIFATFDLTGSEKNNEVKTVEKRINKRKIWSVSSKSPKKEGFLTPLTPVKVLLEHYNRLSEYEYKEILGYSEIYFLGKTKKVFSEPFYDKELYYKSEEGDHIAYRYEIVKALGEGNFGLVLECTDHKTNTQVAIKVHRKGKKFEKVAEDEVSVLDQLSSHEGIVSKLTQFQFRGHFCIVYELLSTDLYNFLSNSNFCGLNIGLIRRIARQLVIALKHIHGAGFIHCDLKPENVLLKAINKSIVKIADFGLSCHQDAIIYTYIQSRFYRAPEVILQAGYSNKIDIWSLGCILFELYNGSPLFSGFDENDQIHRIIETLGKVPANLLILSKRKEKIGMKYSMNGMKIVPMSKPLGRLINCAEGEFVDFLQGCLEIDPQKRLSAESAFLHPWIQGNKINK